MPTPLHRRSFVFGGLGGLAIAGGTALVGIRPLCREIAPNPGRGLTSYAQQGEDYLLQNVFLALLNIRRPTYIDIGAHDPIVGSNTFLFYESGSRGVLVEPNPEFIPKLRSARPGDTILEIGIGAGGETDEDADYYIIRGDGQLNTFSEEVAKSRGIERTIKRKLVNVNKVLAEYFGGSAPDLMSIDTEGYDLTILKSLDFDRFRPRVICAETAAENGSLDTRIIDFMQSKDYEVRGGTWVNTIFVDKRLLAKMYGGRAVEGGDGH